MTSEQATNFGEFPTAERFEALRIALRQSGGIAQGDDLARLLDDHRLGGSVSLAALVARHYVFGFEFRASFWIPMFQFDLHDLSLTYGSASVVAELERALFDGWALANWFARPNARLDNRRPVDVMSATPANVLSAACYAR